MFEGFRPETIDFLWGIRFNNEKSWFEAHKQEYLDYLYNPMKELAAAVYEPLRAEPGLALHVSRIYRDARYAHGRPYKDSLWFSIRHDSEAYWAEKPCLYFDMNPEGYGFGFGVIYPKAEAMNRFRQAAAERPEAFLQMVAETEAATGFSVSGDCYVRKKPCDDPRIASVYQWKNLLCHGRYPVDEALYQPSLAQRVQEAFQGLLPLYRYCMTIF